MFSACCGKEDDNKSTQSELVQSIKGTSGRKSRGTGLIGLHQSLTRDAPTKFIEAIPENQLHLLGREFPLFIKIKPRNRKRSMGEITPLPCEELIGTAIADVTTRCQNVLNVGYDNFDFISKVAQRCNVVVWSPEVPFKTKKLANLKVVPKIESFHRADVIGFFDSAELRQTLSQNASAKIIDYMIFCKFDKSPYKSKPFLTSSHMCQKHS